MNLRLKKRNLIYAAAVTFLTVSLSCLIPSIRVALLDTLRYPLGLVTLIRREIGGIIFYHRNLTENERLKKRIDLLRQKINAANEVYLENTRLESLLSLKQKSSFKVIAARVIGRSADSWSSIIIIDKGRHHGITRGIVAITPLGLAGRVIETARYTSKVMLINDPNLGVSCIVQRSRQEGLITGTLGSSLIMKYLPKEADIQISDTVITSGLSQIYPKGLLVGKVIGLGEEFSGLSRYAVIEPAVNLSKLEEVLLIIP